MVYFYKYTKPLFYFPCEVYKRPSPTVTFWRKGLLHINRERRAVIVPLGELTEKQKRFAEEYLIHGNATKAAEVAGYSVRTAKRAGYVNLNKRSQSSKGAAATAGRVR